MKRFKKGDPVVCSDFGIGYVIGINNDRRYPVAVEFQSDNSVIHYTNDGRAGVDIEITLQHDTHNWCPDK